MRTHRNGPLAAAGLGASLLFSAGEVHATALQLAIDCTSLGGGTAVLAFDFIDGRPSVNTVRFIQTH